MIGPLAIALPSQQGSVAQARAGLNQRAWPGSADATVWDAYPLHALLGRRWDCDAHAFPYTVTGDPCGWGAGRWPRLGVDVLGPETRAVADATWLTSCWLDFDRPDHAPWLAPRDADEATPASALPDATGALIRPTKPSARSPGGSAAAVDESADAPALARVKALAALRRAFPAAAIYDTSAGVRVVHVLAEPVPLRWARWWLHGWVREAALRAAGVPLVLDSTCNEWTRCYRLPRVLRECTAELGPEGLRWVGGTATDPIFLPAPDGAAGRLEWWPDGVPDIEDRAASPARVVGGSGAPPDATAPEGWSSRLRPTGALTAAVLDLLVRHAPFGPPEVAAGTRNPTLKRALNSLATQLTRHGEGYATPSALYAIVAPSVAAEAARDATAPTLDDAWRLAQAASAAAVVRAAVLAPPPPTMPDIDPPDDDGGAPPPPIVHVEGDEGRAYVWDGEGGGTGGAYVGPLRGTGLRAAIGRCAPDVPLLKGRGQLRDVSELLHFHGVSARAAQACYPGAEGGPVWDLPTRTIRVRTLRPPRIEPLHDEAVATWLGLLAGRDTDVLLDWLATAPRLDRPTSALYLEGPPGAGKGMLVASLAALWDTSPVAWREAIGTFNVGLLRSPVVFLDEGSRVGRTESGRFRSLTGERMHRVEEKHQSPVTLHGCPRVVIAANGPGAIDLRDGHAADELLAIGRRILHLDVGHAAVEYLADLGGSEATTADGWVTAPDGGPGRVPRHLAHLARTRVVQPGDRYLVEGVPGVYHLRLVTDDPLYSATLLAVATALAPLGMGVAGGPGVWVAPPGAPSEYRPGHVWVTPRVLHDRWKGLVVEDGHRPQVQAVAKACKALASGTAVGWSVAGHRNDYWAIPSALVERVAHDLGHTDAHRVTEAIAHGAGGPQGAPWVGALTPSGTVVPFGRTP